MKSNSAIDQGPLRRNEGPAPGAEVAILGAGIIGLTTGLRLLAHGLRAVIYARETTPHTTSDVAAAFWLPYKAAPKERVKRWAEATRATYGAMERRGTPGVATAPLLILQRNPGEPTEVAEWADDAVAARSGDLPEGFAGGMRLNVPRIETPIYLPWLHAEFARLGGRFEPREVQRVDELLETHRLVINCSGLGAGTAVPDESVFPIRGQLVRVQRPDRMADTILVFDEGDQTTYIVPRCHDCILGGTAQENDWNREPNAEAAAGIVVRCTALRPELEGARVLGHLVGLRPGRPAVRLETEPRTGNRALIHNYGHGGAGFTLAWACADEVVDRAREWLNLGEASPDAKPQLHVP